MKRVILELTKKEKPNGNAFTFVEVYYTSVPTLFKRHYIKKYERQGYEVKIKEN